MSYQLIANLPDNKPHLLFRDSHVRVMPHGDKATSLLGAAVQNMKTTGGRVGSSPQIRKQMHKALRTVLREVCRGASRKARIAARSVNRRLK